MVNHGTITGTLSLFKILPLNGFNPIRAKQRLHRRRKRVHESFWSRRTSRKSFTLTIPWNWTKSCEDPSWNHRTSTLHRSETNGIAERAGTSAVLLRSGLDEKWWADSTECFCYLRLVQDLLADGKTPNERRFGESLPIIPVGAMVEHHPISVRDHSRLGMN